MTTKYGLEQHEWDAAKAEMRDALVERSKVRGMIPYSELVEKITTIELERTHSHLLRCLARFRPKRTQPTVECFR